MKIAAWIMSLGIGIYSGLFLMPYKVALLTLKEGFFVVLFAYVFGFIGGAWMLRFGSKTIEPLLPVAAFFFISGVLGVFVNMATSISGFPLFSAFATIIALGMFSYWWYKHAPSNS